MRLQVPGTVWKDSRGRKIFASFFQDVSYSQIHRNGNFVAHSLARRATHSSHLLVWMEDIPPDVKPVL